MSGRDGGHCKLAAAGQIDDDCKQALASSLASCSDGDGSGDISGELAANVECAASKQAMAVGQLVSEQWQRHALG